MKSVEISDELYDEVVLLASADRVTVNVLVTALIAERVADWARLEARAARGSLEKFRRVMAKVPDVEPDAFDRL